MGARFKEHLKHVRLGSRIFIFHSFRVDYAVTQIVAGKGIADIMASVNWKSKTIALRYVGGAKTTHYPTRAIPGAAEVRYEAANALAASVDPAVWPLFPSRSASPPQGLPDSDWTACAVSPRTSPHVTAQRASFDCCIASRPTVC